MAPRHYVFLTAGSSLYANFTSRPTTMNRSTLQTMQTRVPTLGSFVGSKLLASSMSPALYVKPTTKIVEYCGNKDFSEIFIKVLEISSTKEEVATVIYQVITSKKQIKRKSRKSKRCRCRIRP